MVLIANKNLKVETHFFGKMGSCQIQSTIRLNAVDFDYVQTDRDRIHQSE